MLLGVTSLSAVTGSGGSGNSSDVGGGGGGAGYGGGGGGAGSAVIDASGGGGGGGGCFGDDILLSTSNVAAYPGDLTGDLLDRGYGGVNGDGIGGAAIIYMTETILSISPEDDITNNATTADALIVRGADKTLGTGNGGALILKGGGGGDYPGNVELGSVLKLQSRTISDPGGTEDPANVDGAMYYHSGENKIKVRVGGNWRNLALDP
jgi:hypothetical protein